MSLEICRLCLLIQRVRFQIQARRIDVSHVNADAVLQRTFSERAHQKRFLAIDLVYLVARLIDFSFFELLITSLFQAEHRLAHKFALGLCRI